MKVTDSPINFNHCLFPFGVYGPKQDIHCTIHSGFLPDLQFRSHNKINRLTFYSSNEIKSMPLNRRKLLKAAILLPGISSTIVNAAKSFPGVAGKIKRVRPGD